MRNQLETLVKKIKQFDILIFLIGLAHKKGRLNDFKSFEFINKKRTLVNFCIISEKYNKVPKK